MFIYYSIFIELFVLLYLHKQELSRTDINGYNNDNIYKVRQN